MHRHYLSWSLVYLWNFFPYLFQELSRISLRGPPRFLSLWWDSYYRSWFREAFSFVLFFSFFFHLRLFDGVHYSYIHVIFFFYWHFDSLLFSFLFLSFPLWLAWHIFLCQIPFLYPDCIFFCFYKILLILFRFFFFFFFFCKPFGLIYVH